jgi:RNA polymerase sigma-70 factor, ECF subfamily
VRADINRVVDEPRFQQLYVDHADAVFTFVSRRLSTGDVEDLVADVFLVAWRRREQLPVDPRGWLLGVARRLLANSRRGEARSAALLDRLSREPAPAANAEEGESRASILSALDTLETDDRDLLELLAWDGLSRDQLAAVFGVNRATIAVRVHRARRKLTAALAARPSGQIPVGRRHSEVKEPGHA